MNEWLTFRMDRVQLGFVFVLFQLKSRLATMENTEWKKQFLNVEPSSWVFHWIIKVESCKINFRHDLKKDLLPSLRICIFFLDSVISQLESSRNSCGCIHDTGYQMARLDNTNRWLHGMKDQQQEIEIERGKKKQKEKKACRTIKIRKEPPSGRAYPALKDNWCTSEKKKIENDTPGGW